MIIIYNFNAVLFKVLTVFTAAVYNDIVDRLTAITEEAIHITSAVFKILTKLPWYINIRHDSDSSFTSAGSKVDIYDNLVGFLFTYEFSV